MDCEHKFDHTNRSLSFTIAKENQDKLIMGGLLTLGRNEAKEF